MMIFLSYKTNNKKKKKKKKTTILSAINPLLAGPQALEAYKCSNE